VVIGDVAATMGQEGRGGPPDAMGFSRDGCSYRWMYVPADGEVLVTGLNVPLGEKGDRSRTYAQLNMARPATVKRWNIDVPVCLAEVEVNDQDGTPAIEGFVATKMRRLDGTEAFPAKLTDVVAEARKRRAAFEEDQKKAVDGAFADALKERKDKKLTGPREKSEVLYVTYLPDKERVRVAFRVTLTDGAYQFGPGGVNPLPPPPVLDRDFGPGQAQQLRRPPPPRFENFRWGTQVTVEYGVAYEATRTGKIDRVLVLPPQAKVTELPPPQQIGPRGPRDPRLPPQPIQPLDR
jgi:hypothetical protein